MSLQHGKYTFTNTYDVYIISYWNYNINLAKIYLIFVVLALIQSFIKPKFCIKEKCWWLYSYTCRHFKTVVLSLQLINLYINSFNKKAVITMWKRIFARNRIITQYATSWSESSKSICLMLKLYCIQSIQCYLILRNFSLHNIS